MKSGREYTALMQTKLVSTANVEAETCTKCKNNSIFASLIATDVHDDVAVSQGGQKKTSHSIPAPQCTNYMDGTKRRCRITKQGISRIYS